MVDPTLSATARLVSIDRPGYGQSAAGGVEPSLARQAAILLPILETNRSGRPAIVLGYSLGGPVAVRAAIDYPHLVGGVILVAPSIDPELEKDPWFAKVSRWRIVSWIIPKPFKDADDEIKPLKAELLALLPHWREIRVPVTVLQGEDDGLVPPANADFARRMLTNAPVDIQMIPGVGHAIAWESTAQIRAAILAQLGGGR
jgi:pimeloyl-ACP methyl ester carboxylesterase